MKNLNRKICSVVVVGIVTFIFSSFGYAGTVTTSRDIELDCRSPSEISNKVALPGNSDTQYSVTSKGLRIDGKEALITKFVGDGGYSEWGSRLRKLVKEHKMLKSDAKKLMRFAKIDLSIIAQCSSDSTYTEMRPMGTKISCNKGDSVIIKLFDPECDVYANQHMVFTITKTKDVLDKVVSDSVMSNPEIGLGFGLGTKDLCWN